MVITIQTDIDEAARQETEAVAMLMRHIAAEKTLLFSTDTDCPHCPILPSLDILKAVDEAEPGGWPSFDGIEELMADLDVDKR